MTLLMLLWEKVIAYLQYTGQLKKALSMCDQLERIIKNKKAEYYCTVLRRRGFIHFLMGSYQPAINDYINSLTIAEAHVYENEIAGICALAGIYFQQHKVKLPIAYIFYIKALSIRLKQNNSEACAKLYLHLATLKRDMKQFDEALELLDKAFGLIKDPRVTVNIFLERGRLFALRGDLELAESEIKFALQMLEIYDFPNERGDCFRELARIYKKQGMDDQSLELFADAYIVFCIHGYQYKAEQMLRELI